MKVLLAEKLGFCFGVEHAIELAEKLLTEGKRVYCLGDLIHNQQVVDRLAEEGLEVVVRLEEIPQVDPDGNAGDPIVLIRSHGCGPELIGAVEARGLELADATCILVKRAQKLVSELDRQGYHVVVVGDPNHPETIGVVGYAPEVTVVENEDDLAKLPASGRLAVISQTTNSPGDFNRIANIIAQGGYEEVKIVNTICHETAHRQDAAVELCRQVDVMFVLGGRNSANTQELANICRRCGVETYHLQDWPEFEEGYVRGHKVAGVTAGASTPDWIIRDFVAGLKRVGESG